MARRPRPGQRREAADVSRWHHGHSLGTGLLGGLLVAEQPALIFALGVLAGVAAVLVVLGGYRLAGVLTSTLERRRGSVYGRPQTPCPPMTALHPTDSIFGATRPHRGRSERRQRLGGRMGGMGMCLHHRNLQGLPVRGEIPFGHRLENGCQLRRKGARQASAVAPLARYAFRCPSAGGERP